MIYKKQKYEKGEFLQISTKILLDKRLTIRARAILIYLLSNKSTWNYNEKNICEHFGIKVTELRSGINQLIEYGYLNRTRVYEGGKFRRYNYDVYENPEDNAEYMNMPF